MVLKNKKAMFFTVLAISLLSLFIISYSIYSSVEDREPVTKRIEGMNNFVFLVEDDLPRHLYIAGYRVIFSFENKIAETGNYINNVNSSFQECFLNGTLNQETQAIMNGVTFSGMVNSLNQKASKVNINLSLTNPEIEISQDDPWNIKISFSGDLMIYDKGELAFWNRSYSKDVYIPIENFEDPFYIVETNGLVTNKINKTIYDDFVDEEDVSNLIYHLENSYYINSTSAPSFLKRLEGVNTADENGIESLVYLPDLSSQGISVKDKSCVDYIYFSENNPADNRIQGMPSWFRLDDEHLEGYEVEGLVI